MHKIKLLCVSAIVAVPVVTSSSSAEVFIRIGDTRFSEPSETTHSWEVDIQVKWGEAGQIAENITKFDGGFELQCYGEIPEILSPHPQTAGPYEGTTYNSPFEYDNDLWEFSSSSLSEAGIYPDWYTIFTFKCDVAFNEYNTLTFNQVLGFEVNGEPYFYEVIWLGDNSLQLPFHEDGIPAPGALALLGLGGIASRRRRG